MAAAIMSHHSEELLFRSGAAAVMCLNRGGKFCVHSVNQEA